ncbi:hypothetical protein EJP77_14275 [Paenibacillus zeisoli]|uniref:Uncharacterized protein n=1 Tax=Paenibacillus zeisoli TaxID=2496267 RepID=A0A433X611_9BACL|nr:hypothetical protein [Paenibacillus zeisoli]RUT29540.1 hypothetical protein EJP77_14275 [Paenibacillus zeisoli]
MKITLDISSKEFDGIVGEEPHLKQTIFLSFQSEIKGEYKFEFMNSTINIFDFKDHLASQGLQFDSDSLFVFGKMQVLITRVKGADIKLLEEINNRAVREQYYTWPYTLSEGNVVCICGGYLSFLADFYASVFIVTESNPKITLTFNSDEALPYDFTSPSSIKRAQLSETKFETNSPGKLFNFDYFSGHFGTGRRVIKSED